MRYILNSAVITTPGSYDYRIVTAEEARQWHQSGPVESTIGYQETADALSVILGTEIPVDRRMVQMASGDDALIFRLAVRLADPSIKGKISDIGWLLGHSEIGILSKR